MNASAPNVSTPNVSAPNVTATAIANMTATAIASVTSAPVVEAWPPPFMLNFVLLLAVVAGCFLFVSPMESVLQAQREQLSLKELASWFVPTYFIFAQSFLWACYGFLTGGLAIARFNAFGAFMCLAYFGLISNKAQPKETLQPLILLAILCIVVFSVGVMALARDPSLAFAFSATLFNLGMIIAPIREAVFVVQTGSCGQFPMAITIASLLQSLFWAQYSMLVHDRLYLIPNLIGTVVCGAELFVVYWIVGLPGGVILQGGNSLEGLEESEHQPLMPRSRGKAGMSNCSNLLSFLSGSTSRERRTAPGFGPYGNAWWSKGLYGNAAPVKHPQQPGAARRLETWGTAKAHSLLSSLQKAAVPEDTGPEFPHKSPFSALAKAEDVQADDIDAFSESFDEPEFEPEDTNEMQSQDTFLNGGTYRPFGGSKSGLDCIL